MTTILDLRITTYLLSGPKTLQDLYEKFMDSHSVTVRSRVCRLSDMGYLIKESKKRKSGEVGRMPTVVKITTFGRQAAKEELKSLESLKKKEEVKK